jgi:CubicO group peptidase (beta-lactamase class C family)/transglutaminase-like putative cysteine protease
MRTFATRSLLSLLLVLLVAPVQAADTPDKLEKVRAAIRGGDFAMAEQLIAEQVPADDDQPVTDPFAIQREIMRRIRLDYSLNAKAMLKRVQGLIPDATAEDVERWTASGDLQHRVIDGKVWYFKRAANTLVRFCAEAKQRRQKTEPKAGWSVKWPQHVHRVLQEAVQQDEAFVNPVKHHVKYTIKVKPNHPRLKKGAKVRAWLPFPQEYRQQQDVRLLKTEPANAVVAPNGHPQRTVYFEQVVEDPAKPPTFMIEFEYTSHASCPRPMADRVRPYDESSELYRTFTAERPPHILFTDEMKKTVAEVVGDETNPLEKARKIFRWVSHNIPWTPEMEYSTIESLSDKGFTARRGDCGVQGLVFVTMCRIAGVPARWQSGFQTLPNEWNLHDWSEFYVEPYGWVPADASYGLQRHDDRQTAEFYCGNLDAYRMIVNLDYGRELHPPKTSFRSEPNDFQRGEVEIDGHNLYFGEWSWDMDLTTTPLSGKLATLDEALTAVVPDALDAGKMSGCVIQVGRKTADGFETWRQAYGYRQFEPAPLTMPEDAIFDMASLTKPLATGLALAKMIEEGRVKLDDPVKRYLPEFSEGDKGKILIRHLATHTSGLPPYVGAKQQAELRRQHGYPCPAHLQQYIATLDLDFEPGARVQYSCLNAIVTSMVIDEVAARSFSLVVHDAVYAPLRLKDTGYLPEEVKHIRCVPTTKAPEFREVTNEAGFLQGQVHDPMAGMGAGISGNAGLFSTAADIGRIAEMLLNEGTYEGRQIFKPETVKLMHTVLNPGVKSARGNPSPRGLLWGLYVPEPGATGDDKLFAFGHTGYTGTALRIYPEQGVYVVVLANRVHPDDSGKVGGLRSAVWETVANVLMREAME